MAALDNWERPGPDEHSLTLSLSVDPTPFWVRVWNDGRIPSVTIRTIKELLQECQDSERQVSRSCQIVYRGQTREYRFRDGVISLLIGRERLSTEEMYRFSNFYDQTLCARPFYQDFFRNIQVIPRREGGSEYRLPATQRPTLYFELLLLQGILQHYGFQTVCLDLTRDPLVAVWFALNGQRILKSESTKRFVTYEPSLEKYGVIYILEVPARQIGRYRKVVPNVLTADLAGEIPNGSWRPRRQSAMAISQTIWSGSRKVDFNRIARCIKKRIVVPTDIELYLTERILKALRMDWLFPPYCADKIYQHVVDNRVLRRNLKNPPELLIYPEYLKHFASCTVHSTELECFKKQTAF
jgi:hypothetical protein